MFKFASLIRSDGVSINPFLPSDICSYLRSGIIIMTQALLEVMGGLSNLDTMGVQIQKLIIIGEPINDDNGTVFVKDIRGCVKYLSTNHQGHVWWFIGDNATANDMIMKGLIMDVYLVSNYAHEGSREWIITERHALLQTNKFNMQLLDSHHLDFELVSATKDEFSKKITRHFFRRNTEEVTLLSTMSNIISYGFKQNNRTGVNTRALFGKQFEYRMVERIDPQTGKSSYRLPLLTSKRMFTRGIFTELKWFLSGGTNSKTLENEGVNIWKGNTSRQYLDSVGLGHYETSETGPIYGFQWKHWGAEYTQGKHDYKGEGIDQVNRVIDSLQKDPFSRRHVISGWNVQDLEQMCLPPCFAVGALVLTSNGYKEIQTLCDSDLVFTHKGNWKPIINRQERTYSGDIIGITSAGSNIPILATAEHPFLTKSIINKNVLSENTSWTPANELKAGKHVMCVPIDQSSQGPDLEIHIEGSQRDSSEIDWYMVGFYVGTGKHVLDVDFIPPGWNILREFTTNPNAEIAVCDFIPEWTQRLPVEDIESFIHGFERSVYSKNGFLVLNEIVALQIQRLYAKTKRFVSICVNTDYVVLHPNNESVSFDDHYMYIPIVSVDNNKKETTVYNLEVADDNSYVVENVATHNCHMLYQFMVHENHGQRYLSLMMTQRSCDTFLGLGFNICSLGMFLMMMAHRVGYKPYKLIHSIADMHIYETHIEAAEEQIKREPFCFPYISINCDPKEKLEDYNYSDIVIDDYYCHGPIKADMIV